MPGTGRGQNNDSIHWWTSWHFKRAVKNAWDSDTGAESAKLSIRCEMVLTGMRMGGSPPHQPWLDIQWELTSILHGLNEKWKEWMREQMKDMVFTTMWWTLSNVHWQALLSTDTYWKQEVVWTLSNKVRVLSPEHCGMVTCEPSAEKKE